MIETLIAITILINGVRSVPLVPDIELSYRAQERAEYLCEKHQWNHDGWQDSFKYSNARFIGENLARGFDNTDDMFDAWMNSESHKNNILKPQYTKVGVGSSCNVVVQLFES